MASPASLVIQGHSDREFGVLATSAGSAKFPMPFHREMVTIVRDRVQYVISKGMTLVHIKSAKPQWTTIPGTARARLRRVSISLDSFGFCGPSDRFF
jgi:hypothetical protein